jgi:death-on-curing protein
MIFLNKTDLLEIHSRAIREFGGSPGLLNEAALESALVAAVNRAWYENADLAACAAAYAFHLTHAHAFIDGNKRVGAAATEVFLLANGLEIRASDDDLYQLFMGVASSERSRDDVEEWLRGRVFARAQR